MQGGVIYDFGMNNGDDVEYYLLKADKVVGVEANPALCKAVEERFAQEIAAGRLVVLNVALSTEDSGRSLDFYTHKTNHVLSQLAAPDLENAEEFERVEVLCRRPSEVIRDHGAPRYVKVDLEGMDGAVLREIFRAGIHPPKSRRNPIPSMCTPPWSMPGTKPSALSMDGRSPRNIVTPLSRRRMAGRRSTSRRIRRVRSEQTSAPNGRIPRPFSTRSHPPALAGRISTRPTSSSLLPLPRSESASAVRRSLWHGSSCGVQGLTSQARTDDRGGMYGRAEGCRHRHGLHPIARAHFRRSLCRERRLLQ
ncbi:FkbM family methyltransferase [Sphingomonas daechungensis]|uniref:FkbM family methyltransferase n=1 Tax=Sphingomonas daechungensis TaxID=1176646 RepID=A0ABX6T157_9SPHN|nr:FkbM family methyltransferase [Sphingomonas daechungensis]